MEADDDSRVPLRSGSEHTETAHVAVVDSRISSSALAMGATAAATLRCLPPGAALLICRRFCADVTKHSAKDVADVTTALAQSLAAAKDPLRGKERVHMARLCSQLAAIFLAVTSTGKFGYAFIP